MHRTVSSLQIHGSWKKNSAAKFYTYLTMSPRRTRRLLRTHRLMRIFSSEIVSSDKTMHTVSFRRLPFIRTVSPRNSCSSSILFCNSAWYYTLHDITDITITDHNMLIQHSLQDRHKGWWIVGLYLCNFMYEWSLINVIIIPRCLLIGKAGI